MINLTTGPVQLTEAVSSALASNPISHRSDEFLELYKRFTDFMCYKLNVREITVLQGSGTLANEAMIWQIKPLKTKGMILSNGEFGNRLIDQSKRVQLDFIEHSIPWGNEFDLSEIKALINLNHVEWILFAHCETSTGVINNLEALANICFENEVSSHINTGSHKHRGSPYGKVISTGS